MYVFNHDFVILFCIKFCIPLFEIANMLLFYLNAKFIVFLYKKINLVCIFYMKKVVCIKNEKCKMFVCQNNRTEVLTQKGKMDACWLRQKR